MNAGSKDNVSANPTLLVENLKTQFTSRAGIIKAVDDVSFSVQPGQIMGLVGESGSGKSMTGYSITGLIDPLGKVVEGSIKLKDEELRDLPEDRMRAIRGNRIAMIFQDPMMTLNPVLRIDTQMKEAVLAHQNVSDRMAHQMARDALARVGAPAPDERLLGYPHQFSHPYTHGLIACAPSRNPRGKPLQQITGMTPSLLHLPAGCAFRERCSAATDICRSAPILEERGGGRQLRCFHPILQQEEVAR